MNRRFTLLITLVSLALLYPEDSHALKRAPRFSSPFFLEAGVLLGAEPDIPGYRETAIRPFIEAGVDLAPERLGLLIGFSMSAEDRRYDLGPYFVQPLSGRWALRASGGLLWSDQEGRYSSEFYDAGWQAKLALCLDDRFSVSLVHQIMDYRMREDIYGGRIAEGTLRATYMGISARSDTPAPVALVAAAAIGALWISQAGSAWTVVAK